MTNYHLTPPATLPSFAVQEAKEKRRQVLARAAQIRKANYVRFLKKRRLQVSSDLAAIGQRMTTEELEQLRKIIREETVSKEDDLKQELKAAEESLIQKIEES